MTRNRSPQNKCLDIVFFIFSAHEKKVLEPEYPENNPLGGSETAALRMAEQFRHMGHNVRIFTDENDVKGINCDVFIGLRIWQVFRAVGFPGKVNYLWCQDDANQPILDDLRKPEMAGWLYQNLQSVFMLSHYQLFQWLKLLNLPQEKVFLTTNGIPLEKFNVERSSLRQRKPWAYYSSTPFRGLSLLLQAWPEIHKAVPESQLHLFTSMKVYNSEESETFTQMYEIARNLPGVVYRSSVGQAELRETALNCRALAYPCIFPETSCIAAMEAMAAGCAVVGTALGALIETAWKNPLITPVNNWMPLWSEALIKILTDDDEYERLAIQNLETARFYDWAHLARIWDKKIREDLESKQ